MALIQMNFMSSSLMRKVTVQVLLPVDALALSEGNTAGKESYKTLYLLHGVFGNYIDWQSLTRIQELAEARNLAVVMPSGDNMFYVDDEAMHNLYGEYIGRELVDVTRKTFPLSDKREDTVIAGLSMGGYGALRNGLKYHDTFGYIGAMSSALIIEGIEKRTNDVPLFIESRAYAERVFGDLDKIKESDKNPMWIAKQLADSGKDIPKIYMNCGTSDSFLTVNRKFAEGFRKLGLDVTYMEGEGAHEWDFWNRTIKDVLDWAQLS